MEGLPISVQYKSIDNVVEVMNQYDYMGVMDIKSAYHSVSVNPEHVKYQGLKWILEGESRYLVDHRLCFGLKCGPYYFNLISDFIQTKLNEMYGIRVINYLDDFITMADSMEVCGHNQLLVINMLRYLGFQISWNKVSCPSQVTQYLGIDIDTVKLELRLPMCKVEKMLETVRSVQSRKTVTKKQLQRLTGMLAHCATIVKGGRTFCRWLYDLEKVANTKVSKCVCLSDAARDDLDWWERFAREFNGKAAIKNAEFGFKPTSDASLSGFGAHLGEDWFCGFWTKNVESHSGCEHYVSPPALSEEDENIYVLELYPVLEGIRRWKTLFMGFKVEFVTDNLQVFFMIRTGRSANKTCMRWLREIFWICASNDIEVESEYIPSKDNVIADAPSRLSYRSISNNIQSILEDCELCCLRDLFEFCRLQDQAASGKVLLPSKPSPSPINSACKGVSMEMLHKVL